jgi:hypothetical protein
MTYVLYLCGGLGFVALILGIISEVNDVPMNPDLYTDYEDTE